MATCPQGTARRPITCRHLPNVQRPHGGWSTTGCAVHGIAPAPVIDASSFHRALGKYQRPYDLVAEQGADMLKEEPTALKAAA